MANINFFALGGLDERGKNLYCLTVNKSIFLFDAGNAKPERSALGVDTVIPTFDYLIKNKSLIKGLFLSSVVAESSSAVPYLLKKLNIKVYSSDVVLQILLGKITEAKMNAKNIDVNYVKPRQIINFGKIKIEPFQTTSFVSQSLGYAIHTPDGTIIYTGNFIFDQYAHRNYAMNIPHLSDIAQKNKVLLLMTPSDTVGEPGYAAPNYLITPYIEAPCESTVGRILFTCFEEDLFKVTEFLDIISKINGPKRIQVVVLGTSLLSTLQYLKYSKNKFKNILFTDLKDNPSAKYFIISGDLELLYATLIRIATGANEDLELNSTDLVILTTPPTKGEELHHAHVLDELARTQAEVLALSGQVINKMSPYYEDIKMMCGIFKPLYFLPVQGLYKDLKRATQAASDAGVIQNNCLVLQNGTQLMWKNGILSPQQSKIKTGNSYVEVASTNSVEWSVLKERQQLSTDGTAIVGMAIDFKTKKLLTEIGIETRGITQQQVNKEDLNKGISDHLVKLINKYENKFINGEVYNLKELRKEATNIVGKFIQQKIKKRPIILIIIDEVKHD